MHLISVFAYISVFVFGILWNDCKPSEKWVDSKVRGWADEEESEKKDFDVIPVCCGLS